MDFCKEEAERYLLNHLMKYPIVQNQDEMNQRIRNLNVHSPFSSVDL